MSNFILTYLALKPPHAQAQPQGQGNLGMKGVEL